MRKKERYEKILAWFRENRPVAETELHYETPFQLLIAVILSAQCTDKRVNMIVPPLYRDFPTPEVLAASTPEVIYEYIRSVSYPNNKAKHLVGMAQMLVKDFNSEVPDTLEELVKLPGVGRKTANIVLNVGYGIVEGIAVDTHVNRIAHRLMLSPKTHAKEPLKTEQDLLKILPHEYWESVNHQWITFGREVCDARKPKCDECPLADLCPSVRVAG